MEAQAEPTQSAAPATKSPSPAEGAVGNDSGWRQTEGKSETLRRFLQFEIPQIPEGFGNAYHLVRALEKQRQINLAIRVARDQGMVVVPKDQATQSFLQEIKLLSDGQLQRKGSGKSA